MPESVVRRDDAFPAARRSFVDVGQPQATQGTVKLSPEKPTEPTVVQGRDDCQERSKSITSSSPNSGSPGLKSRRRTCARFNDWWTLEIAAGVLSIACTVAVVVVLSKFDGKPLSAWHSPLQPNSVLSILTTVAKSSLLLPVAECISQAKWLHFQRPRSLHLIQAIDSASRGPLGAAQLLFTMQAFTAWFGAIITLAALGFDPFVQQILSFEPREVLLNNSDTQLQISRSFDTGPSDPNYFTAASYPVDVYDVDFSIKLAALRGLYNSSLDSLIQCSSPICRFDSFTSLGVCASCTDVLKDLTVSCPNTSYWRCPSYYTTPANALIGNQWYPESLGHSGHTTMFNSSATFSKISTFPETFSDMKLVDFSAITFTQCDPQYDPPCSGANQPIPLTAYDCSLRWCGKTWSGASFLNTTYKALSVIEWDFQNLTVYRNESARIPHTNYAALSADSTRERNSMGNFSINTVDWQRTGDYLQSLFSYDDSQGASNILYQSSDIPALIQNLADSMTNMVRSSPTSTSFAGRAYRTETFINVRWRWMTLPALVVLSASFLLVAMVLQNRKAKAPIWKSSILPLLFHGLADRTTDAPTALLSEMDILSKHEKVRLLGGTRHELQLVAA